MKIIILKIILTKNCYFFVIVVDTLVLINLGLKVIFWNNQKINHFFIDKFIVPLFFNLTQCSIAVNQFQLKHYLHLQYCFDKLLLAYHSSL